jgi:HAD superfamily hydrolase (TIGR01457 family)
LNRNPETYVFDLDGVIYRGNDPQPHASETVRELRRRNRRVFFFTNNATKSRDDYREKLIGMNIPVENSDIMTSAYATALYLRERNTTGLKAYVVGESGLVHELLEAGITVVDSGSDEPVDFVVAGLDRMFTYDKLRLAQQAIIAGAEFIATNRDATFPVENGVVEPGGGALVSAIETASGIKPLVIGKPEAYALEKVLELAQSKPENSVIIGDRLETDILLGNRIGMHTVLPLTGVSDAESATNAPTEMKPQRIISDLIELLDEDCYSQ